eukprot:2342561-Amphidinium_carterae.1
MEPSNTASDAIPASDLPCFMPGENIVFLAGNLAAARMRGQISATRTCEVVKLIEAERTGRHENLADVVAM